MTIYQVIDDCSRLLVGLRACAGGERADAPRPSSPPPSRPGAPRRGRLVNVGRRLAGASICVIEHPHRLDLLDPDAEHFASIP